MKTRKTDNTVVRTTRVWFGDVNPTKLSALKTLVIRGTDIQRFYVDQRWQRQDFSGRMPELVDVHKGRDRFSAPVRLVQPMAKQAAEVVASQHDLDAKTKPILRKNTITLFYHHVEVQRADHLSFFDWVLVLKGAGVPTVNLPFHGHKHLNGLLEKGYSVQRTVRFGVKKGLVYADLIMKKTLVAVPKTKGKVLGIDLNLVEGVVTSEGQRIPMSGTPGGKHKKQSRSHQCAREQADRAVKQLDLRDISKVVLEDLRHIKNGNRGTFPRGLNRRLSHWHRGHFTKRLQERCAEEQIPVYFVNAAYTSQFCRQCFRWDRRNRNNSLFECINCGHKDHADLNAAHNIKLLQLAGAYGLCSLPNAGPLTKDDIGRNSCQRSA